MSAAAKAPDFMIPAKQLPRAIAFSPRFVDPLSGSIFIVIKGETQPSLPSPPLQYKHLPQQQSKNPCFLQVAGTLWQVCTYTTSFAESIGRPSFFCPLEMLLAGKVLPERRTNPAATQTPPEI